MAAAIAEGTTKASESAADHGGREGGSLLPAHVYAELGREAEWVSVRLPAPSDTGIDEWSAWG
jgi:hypothetical protein